MPIKQQQFTPAIWFELKLTPKSTPIGYFTEVSGLSSEVEVMTYNEGGKNDGVHKLPTRMKHPNLVLKRGVTTVKDLQEWAQDSFAGPQRKEITLTMYNEQLEKIRIWSFKVPPERSKEELLGEFIRLLSQLPEEGLIIDVRANPGGSVNCAERLLQTLTHRTIEPELFQFIKQQLAEGAP